MYPKTFKLSVSVPSVPFVNKIHKAYFLSFIPFDVFISYLLILLSGEASSLAVWRGRLKKHLKFQDKAPKNKPFHPEKNLTHKHRCALSKEKKGKQFHQNTHTHSGEAAHL